MKLADSSWTFDSPGPMPWQVVNEFYTLIGKITSQVDDVQDILEMFKDDFAKAHGVTTTSYSSSVGWSDSDMRSHMDDAAKENAPLFIKAFMEGCRRLQKQGVGVPSDAKINGILKEHKTGFRVQGDVIVAMDGETPDPRPEDIRYSFSEAGELEIEVAPEAKPAKKVAVYKAKQQKALKVFLCHASSDKPAVKKLYRSLKDDGYDPWLDAVNLLPGEDWEAEIRKAIRETHVVVVCLSHHSVTKAGFVQKEIKFALDVADEQPEGRIFIIPARLEDCKVPDRLSKWHWVNLFEDDGYQKLLASLSKRAAEL
jgi:hypothetical protein